MNNDPALENPIQGSQALDKTEPTSVENNERKRYERLLDQEKGLLQILIDSIDDLIFYKDLEGKYLGCNQAYVNAVGKDRQTIIGKTDFELLPTEKAEFFTSYDAIVKSSRETVRYETTSLTQDGQETVSETRKCPYYAVDGALLGVIGVVRDITEQKKNEKALRKAHTDISQLIASLTSILVVISSDLEVIHWNNAATKVFGVRADLAVGQVLPGLSIELDWDFLLKHIEICRIEKRPMYLDPFRFTRLNGRDGYLGFNISPLLNQENEVTGFILLGGDITNRIESEAQQTQAQKLESIGQLAAGIAHEINTPIQYIGDNIRFLKDGFDGLWQILDKYQYLKEKYGGNPAFNEFFLEADEAISNSDLDFFQSEVPLAIEQSLEGVGRVAAIVNAMKEFSHPGLITKVPLNLNSAIENTITVARNEWKYIAEVVLDLDPDIPEIMCIPGEINQVLLNITINAVQAIEEVVKTKSGTKGEIKFSTRLDQDFVEVRIKDTGNGIPEHIRTRIFEPFFTTKEVGKGTGQGLAISYNIVVNKHGGEITFESTLGQGTTFIVRLPLNDDGDHGAVQQ